MTYCILNNNILYLVLVTEICWKVTVYHFVAEFERRYALLFANNYHFLWSGSESE